MKKFITNIVCRSIMLVVFLLLSTCMIYGMIYYSTIPHADTFFQQYPFWLLINLAFIFSGMMIFNAILGKCWITILAAAIISFVWSIANYYTVIYHGSPLFLSEYANIKTALEVAGGYSFEINENVTKLFFIFLVLLIMTFLVKVLEKKIPDKVTKKSKKRICELIIGLAGFGMAMFFVIGPLNLKPETTMGWSWKSGILKYGFVVCCVEDAHNGISDPYMMPEGYSLDALSQVDEGKKASTTEYPNLILILNETFYDIEEFYEIDPDESPLEKFYSIDNAVFGFVPSGGGTNDSEYELLTSNSLYLLNATSPYNFVNMKNQFSVVEYVEALGYSTIGMHCGQEENYHRNRAYRDIGFDRIFLGGDDFQYRENNYNRGWLDSENYKDMMDHLEEDTANPLFTFLLTYQNHGGYDQNDDSLDTIHSGIDYGEYTSQLNEFMSSLKLSSDAFFELTESLKDKEPTIVLMVGDHGPTLKKELTQKKSENEYDSELVGSMVPYVIWTNYKEIPAQYGKLASMEDLVPMMLDVAGLPISSYYSAILELHNQVPLRNVNGLYIDAEGKEGQYSVTSEYYDLMKNYYYMEYNSLDKENAKKEIFMP